MAVCPSVCLGVCCPVLREGFAAELPWLPGLRRLPRQERQPGFERAHPGAKGRWEQRGCQRQSALPGWYKKAAVSVSRNICLLCNSYLQKHAKWHSAEVCLYLILLITLFPGSGLLNELSQFSWGGWNHLKTNFLFCFDGWSQPNLFLGRCIETPPLYFPFNFAVTRTVFYVRPKWLLLKPEQRMWFGHSVLLCVPKILVSQCSPYDQIDVYLLRSPPLLTNWIIIKKNWTHNS